MSDKSIALTIVAVSIAFVILVVAIILIVNSTVEPAWRTCQASGGFGAKPVCLNDVESLDQIKTRSDGCLTDGNNVICGSYWQRQDRW